MTAMTDTMVSEMAISQPAPARRESPLGKAIRNRRIELGMTQHDLGERIGCDFWAVKSIERGAVQPMPGQRMAIEVALRLPMGTLDGLGGAHTGPIRSQASATPVLPLNADAPWTTQPGRMRTFILVLSCHGELMLSRDLNEAAAAIDQSLSAVIQATETITHDGQWFTCVLRYRAFEDLFRSGEEE